MDIHGETHIEGYSSIQEFVKDMQPEFDDEFNDFHLSNTLFIFTKKGGCIVLYPNGKWEYDAAPFAD